MRPSEQEGKEGRQEVLAVEEVGEGSCTDRLLREEFSFSQNVFPFSFLNYFFLFGLFFLFLFLVFAPDLELSCARSLSIGKVKQSLSHPVAHQIRAFDATIEIAAHAPPLFHE
jgi:hypothetical protein